MDTPAAEPLPDPPPDAEAESPVRPAPAPARGPVDGVARRLQSRIETADPIIAWTRGWVSREMPLHGVLAARTLDFAVLTERWIFLLNTGFFTRRPRRCVYAARLEEINVTDTPKGRGRRVRIASRTGRPLWIELRSNSRSTTFADALVARTRRPPS